MRDHKPLIIEDFNGLWDRGDPESVPSDHFIQADNIQFINSGFETRDALDKFQTGTPVLGSIVRIYNYVMQSGPSLLVMVQNGDIYHIIPPSTGSLGPQTVHGPILSVGAVDFGFVAIAGRAYITPIGSNNLGMANQFLYVYKGDGVPARKAGGFPPSNTTPANTIPPVNAKLPFLAYNSDVTGVITKGLHVIAVSYNEGILGPIENGFKAFAVVDAPGNKQIQLTNVPIGPAGTTSRTIVMTKVIPYNDFTWNTSLYTYYRAAIVGASTVINDNTTTSAKLNITDAAGLLTVYVDVTGTPAPVTNAMIVVNSSTPGYCDFGFHLVGVVYETDTGYLSAPGPEHFAGNTYANTSFAVAVDNIPIAPGGASSSVKKRHLVSTKAIPEYNGDQKGYQFFFIPNGTIDSNIGTAKVVSYYDSDLVDDASHLMDNFSEIPAGNNLTTYHSRLVLVGDGSPNLTTTREVDINNPDNRSVARLSAPGEPEAISQVDGLIIAPLDGNPLTNAQDFRDILYLFKDTKTYAYSDNRDEPATWQEEVIDQGTGAPIHGIAKVLDAGGVNIDYLLIANISGLVLFNGIYSHPELSWKIEDYWRTMTKELFIRSIDIVNDTINKKIWIVITPDQAPILLHADYGNGLDAKNIRWSKWVFDNPVSCVCLTRIDLLILGMKTGPSPAFIPGGLHYINPAKRKETYLGTFNDSHYSGIETKIPNPTIRTALFGE